MRMNGTDRLGPRGRLAWAAGFALLLGSAAVVMANGDGTSGFLLGGNATHAADPQNPSNHVIRIDTLAPPFYGTVSRKLNARIHQLDNMLEFKSYFENRSCGGGSPRIQLAIDLDGDGAADGNAFGHVRPPFTGCPPDTWQYDDVTDALPRWDVSQLVADGFPTLDQLCPAMPLLPLVPGVVCPIQTHSGYIPWDVFELVLKTLFPYHTVCSGALVDDSGWMAGAAGTAYYDVISLGRMTWYKWPNTAGRGFAQGCAANDHDDDHHDGDCDRDHDYDDDDHEYDRKRREHWGDY